MDFLRTTRAAYDTIAADYAACFQEELAGKPVERALLRAFAELVGDGRVVEVGCGPGNTTAYLNDLGADAFGVDLSPRMVEVARAAHPGLRFEVGSMTALDVEDGALGGVVAWYSIIHIPDERLPEVFAEFRRVLRPGGHVLLCFQTGDEHVVRTEAFGHAITLEYYWRRPERVVEMLGQAGLTLRSQTVREPDEGVEKVPRAYLFAC
ncbi:class I SAM-dependent DNA methyltransferase [Nonomuraea sp. NPDC050556]|uniref:class I SAM-dependent DNA methyltransferase n=1 Tax=Nonomuraea sp. NPDC050556 TaxID=3364369 RepID=UPI00379D96B3